MALWLLEARAEIGAPPLTDAQVDAILARRRGRVEAATRALINALP